MKNLIKHSTLVLMSLALAGQLGIAQYAEDALRFSQPGLGVGARSLGMGNAAVGFVDDYSALFWNPAALAQMRSYEFSVGLSGQRFGNDVSYLGAMTNSANTSTTLNNLGIVYPVPTRQGSLTFALGFGRVADYTSTASMDAFNGSSSMVLSLIPSTNLYSLSSSSRKDLLDNNIPYNLFLADTANGYLVPLVRNNVQQTISVLEGGGLNNWSLGGAIDVAKDFSVGVSVNLVSGSYTYDRQFTESDPLNLHSKYDVSSPNTSNWTTDLDNFTYESTIKSDISGYNFLIGLMYHKQGRFKVGFALRTPTYYSIDETFTDDARTRFDNGDHYSISFNGNTKYKIITPYVYSGGASFQISDWLVLAGDAEYTDWSSLEFDTNNQDLIDENHVIKNIFRPTTNLRGGTEITLWDLGIKLRGGIIWNPSPFKADASDASFDHLYYTAGVGFLIDEHTTLNVGYALGTWKTFRDNYYVGNTASRTSERVNSNNANVTLSYRF